MGKLIFILFEMTYSKLLTLIALMGSLKAEGTVKDFDSTKVCKDVVDLGACWTSVSDLWSQKYNNNPLDDFDNLTPE